MKFDRKKSSRWALAAVTAGALTFANVACMNFLNKGPGETHLDKLQHKHTRPSPTPSASTIASPVVSQTISGTWTQCVDPSQCPTDEIKIISKKLDRIDTYKTSASLSHDPLTLCYVREQDSLKPTQSDPNNASGQLIPEKSGLVRDTSGKTDGGNTDDCADQYPDTNLSGNPADVTITRDPKTDLLTITTPGSAPVIYHRDATAKFNAAHNQIAASTSINGQWTNADASFAFETLTISSDPKTSTTTVLHKRELTLGSSNCYVSDSASVTIKSPALDNSQFYGELTPAKLFPETPPKGAPANAQDCPSQIGKWNNSNPPTGTTPVSFERNGSRVLKYNDGTGAATATYHR